MIIDGHAHAYGVFGSAERLLPLLDSLGVDKIVLCPGSEDPKAEPRKIRLKESWITTTSSFHLFANRMLRMGHKRVMNRETGNNHVNSIRELHPDRVLQFYWVNLLVDNFEDDLLEYYKKWNFQGIKLHQCVIPFRNDSPEMQRLSEIAAEKKLPVFIHIYNGKEAQRFTALAQNNPETNYIVAHLMGMEYIIKDGSNLENVYFDTSPYYIISNKRIMKAIEIFGIERIIMGSDSPIGIENLKNVIIKIDSLKIKQEEKTLIKGGNISRLLGL
jgi:predicted TIM-barrel fold metal-dependent hydrolase